jgi:hypothetical protein
MPAGRQDRPRDGARQGPRDGARQGPRDGARQGPRDGARQGPRDGEQDDARDRPLARLLVAGGIALEAAVLVALAGATAVAGVRGSAQDRVGALFLAVTALALAAGLVAVAVGVRRGMRWSRSPALVWQVIQVLVGLGALTGPTGVPLVLLGGAVGYGVLRADVVPHEVRPPR